MSYTKKVLSVPCPHCHIREGKWCLDMRTPEGRTRCLKHPHPARVRESEKVLCKESRHPQLRKCAAAELPRSWAVLHTAKHAFPEADKVEVNPQKGVSVGKDGVFDIYSISVWFKREDGGGA
jgi:hypothetical protein